MFIKDHFYLGKIVKKHSFKGEVIAQIEADFTDFITTLESVWLEENNQLIPFFIDKISQKNTLIFRIHLEDINTEHEAKKLIGKSLYLPKSELPEYEDYFSLKELQNFIVMDNKYGNIGPITYINDSTSQVILEVLYGEKKILIPYHDDFVVKIDTQKKELHLSLPEGLLDL